MKHLLTLSALMLLCLGLGSCTVDQMIDTPVTASKTGSFTAYVSTPTKTSHDGLKTYWQENDQIALYSSETDAAPIVYSITHFNEDDSAVFQGPALDPDVLYTAMYPYVEGKTMKDAKDYILENQHQISRIGSNNLKNTDILVASEVSAAMTEVSFSHDIALVHIRTIASTVSGTDGVSVRGAWGDRVYYLKLSSIGSSSDYVDAYIAVPSTSEYFSNIYITYYKNGQAIPAKYTMPRSITLSEGQILIMNMTINSWPTQTATSLPKYDCDGVKAGHEYVEVAGTKWAVCNLGAMFPWENGGHYAWGETQTKSEYNTGNYSLADMTSDMLRSEGVLDANYCLTPSYDAASVNWGSAWKIPTDDQLEALINEDLVFVWNAVVKDKPGLAISDLYNQKEFFIPRSGDYFNTYYVSDDEAGFYWSSKYDREQKSSRYLLIDTTSNSMADSFFIYGYSIRPVLSE